MSASSRSTWLVEKTHSSYQEFRNITDILFPPSSEEENLNTLHDDFSFVCSSCYVKMEWYELKRIPYVCIQMYLQTKQQKGKRGNTIFDTRFTSDDINSILQTEGFKEWEQPYPLGSRDKNPFLLVHAVHGCADRTYCGGELRTKGPGRSVATEDTLKATQKGTVDNMEENDDGEVGSCFSGKGDCVFVVVRKSTAKQAVKNEPVHRVSVKKEKADVLKKIPAVRKETYLEPGDNRKRLATEAALESMKRQRQQEQWELDEDRPPRTIAVKHHNVSTPDVKVNSVGKFDINRLPDSRDRDNLTSTSSKKYTHHNREDSPNSADESRNRHAKTMTTGSKRIPEKDDLVMPGSEENSSGETPTKLTSGVMEDEEEFYDTQHQLTTEGDGKDKVVPPPASAMINVSPEEF